MNILTSMDKEWSLEEEYCLFPVSGRIKWPSAHVDWMVHSIKPNVKVSNQSLYMGQQNNSAHVTAIGYQYKHTYMAFIVTLHGQSK